MAIKEVLRLVVEADARGAVKGVEDFGNRSERAVSKSEKALDRWGNRLTSIGAGMIGFGAVAIAGLASTADAASDLGEVMSKNTVVFDDSAAKVEEFAEGAAKIGQSKRGALEAATGFGNLFTSMGLAADRSADMSIEFTKLASDLASFSNTSPEEAIEALTSALIGEAEPIRKYGVLLDDATLKQQALDMGLISTTTGTLPPAIKAQAAYAAILEQTTNAQGDFGRTSDSSANQQRVLAANFENLKASIGQGVLPAMTSLLNVANDVIGGFQGINSVTDGTVGKIATFASVGLVAAGGISVVVGQAIKMRENLSTAADAVKAVTGKMGEFKGILAGGAIAAGIIGIAAAFEQMRQQRNAEVIDDLAESFVAMGSNVDQAFAEMLPRLEEFGQLDELFDQLRDSNVQAAERFIDTAEAAGVSAGAIDEMRASLEQKQAADVQGAVDQETNTAAVEEGAAAFGEQAKATEEAKSALEEYNDALKGLTDPIFAAMDAINGQRDAQLAYSDAQAEVLTAQAELDKAIKDHGQNSEEAAEATRTLEDAQRGLTDAEWGTVESAAEVDSALASLKDAVERGEVSTDSFRSTLRTWVAQGFLTQRQADLAALSVGGLASEAEEADKQRVDIPVRTNGAVKSRTELRTVRDAAHSIPSGRNTHVSTTGTQRAIGELDDVARRVNNIIRNGNVHVSVGGGGGLILHEGGVVGGRPGQELLALVQAGEEMLTADDPRHVKNLGRLETTAFLAATVPAPSFVAGGSTTATYIDQRHITVHTGADPQGVVEALKRYERSNGPIPVTVR